jgi:hypothetical protein
MEFVLAFSIYTGVRVAVVNFVLAVGPRVSWLAMTLVAVYLILTLAVHARI